MTLRGLSTTTVLPVAYSNTQVVENIGNAFFKWCACADLNRDVFRHMPLKHTCLPIPPQARFGSSE